MMSQRKRRNTTWRLGKNGNSLKLNRISKDGDSSPNHVTEGLRDIFHREPKLGHACMGTSAKRSFFVVM
jgi:hypothetical protein